MTSQGYQNIRRIFVCILNLSSAKIIGLKVPITKLFNFVSICGKKNDTIRLFGTIAYRQVIWNCFLKERAHFLRKLGEFVV